MNEAFYTIPTETGKKDAKAIFINMPRSLSCPPILDNSHDCKIDIGYTLKTSTTFDSKTGKAVSGTVEIESDWPIPEDECNKICDEAIEAIR